MYKTKTPNKLAIPPPSLDIDGTMSSFTAKKRKTVFLTQAKKLSNEQQITQNHHQLVNYIDTLQQKVQKIIESHDAQFLIAYKNHLNRVRQQMQELRSKNAKEANSSSSHTQKIQTLQKELIIFREQSLRLFSKMTDKDKEIQLLKMKVYQLETEHKFNTKTIADLMKRNKYLEGMAKEFDINKTFQKFERNNDSSQKKKSYSFLEVNTLRKYASQQKRTSRNVGLVGDLSLYYPNKGDVLNDIQKESRPTTTALGSKRNSISMYSQNNTRSVNEYFAKTMTQNFKKT